MKNFNKAVDRLESLEIRMNKNVRKVVNEGIKEINEKINSIENYLQIN